MKKDIFLLAFWMVFGLSGTFLVALMLYVITGLNIETDIAPYNTWSYGEAMISGMAGCACVGFSLAFRKFYFESGEDE